MAFVFADLSAAIADLEQAVQDILAGVQSLDAKDYATETTLAAALVQLQDASALLASLDAKDYATETTLATRASEATLATRASEATLADVLTEAAAAAALLASIDAKDFATETTLAAVLAALGDVATQTTLADLLASQNAANGLLASIDGKDFATETTLAAVLAAIQAGSAYTPPGDGSGRTHVQAYGASSGLMTLHTVAPGKIFYLTDLIVSLSASGSGTPAQMAILDGATNVLVVRTNDDITGLTSSQEAGATVTHSFREPLQFQTSCRAQQGATDARSITIVGYEA